MEVGRFSCGNRCSLKHNALKGFRKMRVCYALAAQCFDYGCSLRREGRWYAENFSLVGFLSMVGLLLYFAWFFCLTRLCPFFLESHGFCMITRVVGYTVVVNYVLMYCALKQIFSHRSRLVASDLSMKITTLT